jgi:hypothetical protein
MPIDIEKQKSGFNLFLEDRTPILIDFVHQLGFKNSHKILNTPSYFLESLTHWLTEQDITEDDKNWITVRIGYFIGELFVEKYDGCWSVCESQNSRYFGNYIVSQFSTFNNSNALFAPMEAAYFLANEAKGRSLTAIIDEIETGLNAL